MSSRTITLRLRNKMYQASWPGGFRSAVHVLAGLEEGFEDDLASIYVPSMCQELYMDPQIDRS